MSAPPAAAVAEARRTPADSRPTELATRLLAEHHELLNNLNDAVFKTDPRGRFTYLNAAWTPLTGCPVTECLGKFCGSYILAEDRWRFRQEFIALVRGDVSVYRCEARLMRADGGTRWVQISVQRLVETSKDTSGIVGTLVDISESKAAQEQLIHAREQAEAANRAKIEFLSTMSHELRTPLNAVIGLAESLLETGAPFEADRTLRYLEIIRRSGRQLLTQINDVLDLARVEAGRTRLNAAPLDLGLLCAATLDVAQREIRAKRLHADVRRPATPVILTADERLLRQVMQNLVSNAVKFTPEGGRIAITVEPSPSGGAQLAVSDTGIGIPPEKMHLLFKPFSQVDSSLSRRYGGTGLGLALVERLVRLHGGAVTVRSTVNEGSTFVVELPGCAAPTVAASRVLTVAGLPSPAATHESENTHC